LKDYYQILKIEKSASQNDIKKAYRKLVLSYHPDLNPDPEAKNSFWEISEAYSILSDEEKRRKYDAEFSGTGISELFSGYYKQEKRRKRKVSARIIKIKEERKRLQKKLEEYSKIVAIASILFLIIALVDFILPVDSSKQIVISRFSALLPNPSEYISTESFKIPIDDNLKNDVLPIGSVIKVYFTPFLKIPRKLEILENKSNLIFIPSFNFYSGSILFLLILYGLNLDVLFFEGSRDSIVSVGIISAILFLIVIFMFIIS
jgi:hypothetical protein